MDQGTSNDSGESSAKRMKTSEVSERREINENDTNVDDFPYDPKFLKMEIESWIEDNENVRDEINYHRMRTHNCRICNSSMVIADEEKLSFPDRISNTDDMDHGTLYDAGESSAKRIEVSELPDDPKFLMMEIDRLTVKNAELRSERSCCYHHQYAVDALQN